MEKKCPVTRWFPDKGYGFITLDGRQVFIHKSAIRPPPLWEADLTGQTIVVLSTASGQKGLSVSRAVTLEEHEKEEARRAEEVRREEKEKRDFEAWQERLRLEEEQKRAKQEEFRPRFESELEAWRIKLELDLEVYGSEDRSSCPYIKIPSWRHLVPPDLLPELEKLDRKIEKRQYAHYTHCRNCREAIVESIALEVGQDFGLELDPKSDFIGRFTRDERCLWNLTTVRSQIQKDLELSILQRNRQLGRRVEEQIFRLAEEYRHLYGAGCRFERPTYPVTSSYYAGIFSGVDSNGDAWRCDDGQPPVQSTSYALREDLQAWLDAGHADHALRVVEEEIAILKGGQ